jgi:O-antigen/teichoic acid export membrane protein
MVIQASQGDITQVAESSKPPSSGLRGISTRLLRGSAVYGSTNFCLKALGLLLVLVYTRFLAPADYGTITLAETLASLAALLWGLSLTSGLLRLYFEYVEDRTVLVGYVSSVLRGAGVATATGVVLTFIILPPLLRHLQFSVSFYPFIALAVGAAAANSIADYKLALYQVEHLPKRYMLLSAFMFLATAAATVILVVGLRWGAVGMMIGKFAGGLAAALVALVLLRPWFHANWNRHFFSETVAVSLPLVPHQVMALALVVADRFVLQHYRSLTEVGLYSIAYTFGTVMLLVTLSVGQAWSPLFFETAKRGDGGRAILGRLTSALILLFTAIACVGSLIAQPITRWILDPRYRGAGRLIPWVIGAYLLHSIFSLCHLAVLQGKATRLILYASTCAAAANLALNFWWIPRWGSYGAAYATIASYGIEAVLMYLFAQRVYRLNFGLGRIAAGLCILAATLALTQFRTDLGSLAAGLVADTLAFALLAGRDLRHTFHAIRTPPDLRL